MEKEQIIKALAHWAKNFDGKLTDLKTLCESLTLILEQDKRVEELETSCTELTQCCTKFETLYTVACKRAGTAREDTVRKMVERLKEKAIDVDTDDAALWMECVTIEDVNKIAKELLENNDG